MKTSTSFAVLAILATAGSSIAAPLPHHSNHKGSSHLEESHDRHHHNRAQSSAVHPMVDASVDLEMNLSKAKHNQHKTQHARANPLSATKPLNGATGLPAADNLGTGSRNGHKMGKTKGQPTLNANKTISPTSDSVHGALKPLNSDTTKVGQQLNHPNSGNIGHLGKTADDALEPQETQVSKNVLPRDVVSSAVGNDNNSAIKPVQTAATGISKNVATVNNNGNNRNGLPVVGSDVNAVTNGNKILPSVTGGTLGQDIKSVTSGGIALPSASTALLNPKGGILDVNNGPLGTNNGLVGTAGKLVTGTTGSLTNTKGQNLDADTKTVTGTVGKLPNTAGNVVNGANIDPVSNQAYQINTDGTESDVKQTTNTNANKANNHGPSQANKKLNALAFQGNGTNHRADGHPSDGSRSKTTQLINDNTNTNTSNNATTKQVNKTGQNVVGVNTDSPSSAKGLTTDTSRTSSNVQKQSDKTLNSTNQPVDMITDPVIPSNTQKTNGSLITANSDSVNAKIIQTPGKSDNVAETNTNDITGSKAKSDNVNIKVALPQQASGGTNNSNNPIKGVNAGNGVVSNGNSNGSGVKVGPSDQRGNVVQQVDNNRLLQQDAKANTASSKPHSNPSASHSQSPQQSSSHTAASHSSSATEIVHQSTIKPQVFVEYTSFASSPSSTIASQSASVTSSTSATPLAEANVHSGTIQVNKNSHSTSSLKLPLTSSVHLPLPSSGASSSTSKTLNSNTNTTTNKPRQARVTYGEKGEHVVACDGKKHQAHDMIDECIKADLLDMKPNQTEACPTDMQHDIHYGVSTDMLNNTNNQQVKEIQKYVRLCLTANSF